MSNLSDWIHDDITWCGNLCTNKTCERNLANRKTVGGMFSMAMFRETDTCPLFKKKDDKVKAVIKVEVPEYQIGQEVSIYFKDTMMIRSTCEAEKEVVRCKDCKHWIGGGIDNNDNFIPPKCTLFNETQPSEWFCPAGQYKKGKKQNEP